MTKLLACLFFPIALTVGCQTIAPEGERWYDDPDYEEPKDRPLDILDKCDGPDDACDKKKKSDDKIGY